MATEEIASKDDNKVAAPKLSILHLMILTTIVAVELTIGRSFPLLFMRIYGIPAAAMMVTVAIIVARHKWSFPSYQWTPGQWLAIACSIQHYCGIGATIVFWRSMRNDILISAIWTALFGVLMIVSALVWIFAIRHVRLNRIWLVTFWMMASRPILTGMSFILISRTLAVESSNMPPILKYVFMFFFFGPMLLHFTCIISLMVATIQDAVFKTPRDWLHYVGAVCVIIAMLIGAA